MDVAIDSGQNSFRRGVMSLVILGLLKKKICMAISLCRKRNGEAADESSRRKVRCILCFTSW